MVLYNADGGHRRDERQRHAHARLGRGPRGSRPQRHASSSTPAAVVAQVELDLPARHDRRGRGHRRHGPGHLRPGADPASPRRSPFGITADFHGTHYEGDAAGMGNPHLVLFVDDPATARVTQHGPHLEHDDRFPRRTNVEFVRVTPGADDELDMRVWERGVGETLSCGTGACAVAAVAHRRGLVGERVVVHVPGGDLVGRARRHHPPRWSGRARVRRRGRAARGPAHRDRA